MNAQQWREAARKGGLARIAKYGNLGTPEGRRKGGLNSVRIHRKNKTGFNVRKTIRIPRNSARLAELIGIFMGDGHVGTYQASVTTNSHTDLEHARYIRRLIEDLFGIQAPLSNRRDSKACVIRVSSRALCEFMTRQGIPQGNKIALGLRIPIWIQRNTSYRKFFLRGLFDSDGCVYIDTHRYKQKAYRNLGMAFANQSVPLLTFFKETLELLKLHPTQKTKYRVFLRRKEDIRRYFDLVGSSNEKHLKKIREYSAL